MVVISKGIRFYLIVILKRNRLYLVVLLRVNISHPAAIHELSQGCHIRAKSGSDDGFQISFQNIWLDESKCSEIQSENVPDLSHFGLI